MGTLPNSLMTIVRRMNNGAHTAVDDNNQVHVFVKLTPKAAAYFGELSQICQRVFVYPMPTAPLVCWFFESQRNNRKPLQQDMYFNVCNSAQAGELEQLARQTNVGFHLVEDRAFEVLTKTEIKSPSNIKRVLSVARNCVNGVHKEEFDFDAAERAFRGEHSPANIAGLLSDFNGHAKSCTLCGSQSRFADVFRVMEEFLDIEVSGE
jgi:hypothetical protein